MLRDHKEIILWDTEFTSWEVCNPDKYDHEKNQLNEIIQIGAVLLRTEDFAILNEMKLYVKPVLNPILSGFITELTGITQAQVDGGLSFHEALKHFIQFKGERLCYSYKNDYRMLVGNVLLHRVNVPAEWIAPLQANHYFDVRDAFFAEGIEAHKYNSSSITTHFGISIEGAHDALADVRAMAKALKALYSTSTDN